MKLEGWSIRECVLPYNARLWTSPNLDATNSSLFTGLPGGARSEDGQYSDIGNYGLWWSSTEYNTGNAWYRYMNYAGPIVDRDVYENRWGMSVRLIKN